MKLTLPKLQGIVDIKLFNKQGKEVIHQHSHNLITNGGKIEVLRKFINSSIFSSFYISNNYFKGGLYKSYTDTNDDSLFETLLLYNDTSYTPVATNRFVPMFSPSTLIYDESRLTGWGDATTTSGDVRKGILAFNQCHVTQNSIKLVWSFDEATANGTFDTVGMAYKGNAVMTPLYKVILPQKLSNSISHLVKKDNSSIYFASNGVYYEYNFVTDVLISSPAGVASLGASNPSVLIGEYIYSGTGDRYIIKYPLAGGAYTTFYTDSSSSMDIYAVDYDGTYIWAFGAYYSGYYMIKLQTDGTLVSRTPMTLNPNIPSDGLLNRWMRYDNGRFYFYASKINGIDTSNCSLMVAVADPLDWTQNIEAIAPINNILTLVATLNGQQYMLAPTTVPNSSSNYTLGDIVKDYVQLGSVTKLASPVAKNNTQTMTVSYTYQFGE